MTPKQYQFWSTRTQFEAQEDSNNQVAPIHALELAAGILKDARAEFYQLMLKAIFSVKFAYYCEDEALKRAILLRFDEIDKLIVASNKEGAA